MPFDVGADEMSAFSSLATQRRALKKSRLGPPDVYPQEPKQREDDLSATILKNGFTYNPVPNSVEEYGSARNASGATNVALTSANVSAYFNGVLAKKEEFNTIQDSSKKRPVFNVKDQFFLVTKPSSKTKVDAWFKELNISKPAQPLAKQVPVFNKKEDVLMTLYEYGTAYAKATWFIKLTAAYAAVQSDNKVCFLESNVVNWLSTPFGHYHIIQTGYMYGFRRQFFTRTLSETIFPKSFSGNNFLQDHLVEKPFKRDREEPATNGGFCNEIENHKKVRYLAERARKRARSMGELSEKLSV